MKALVISPERVLFEGEVASVYAPAFDGEVGILPRHAPMVTLLGRGVLRLQSSPVGPVGVPAPEGGTGGGAGLRRFQIEGGFLQVADDVVRLVTEQASPADSPAPARGGTA
jgi:F-type H+-transporting ATPase subunit epsilon